MNLRPWTYTILLFNVIFAFGSEDSAEFCPINPDDTRPTSESCGCGGSGCFRKPKYLMYDVNPPEGFNLRRDVYMRIAVLAKRLARDHGDWHLVLPPWPHLYHWRSEDLGAQSRLPWSLFFDLSSLQRFAPVMDMSQYLAGGGPLRLERVVVLQHYKEDWAAGRWEDKFSVQPCNEDLLYSWDEGEEAHIGPFWGYQNVTAESVECVSFHGHAEQLGRLVQETGASSVMVDHAEIALHDAFGDSEYWRARRSMRFAAPLRRQAAQFRRLRLNSTDEADRTRRPANWLEEQPQRTAVGGPFLCAHLRRRDFLWGRPTEVPSIGGAAKQIRSLLAKHKLKTVFISSDMPDTEFQELEALLPEFSLERFRPSQEVRRKYKDGGVAIVDQIICSHARYFTGTHESTYSFRIQEEREIIGFPVETTFNRLCGDADGDECEQPSRWKIAF